MIIHVTSYFEDAESAARNRIARETWGITYRQGGWTPLPILDESLPRLFPEGNRKLPYVKDLINETLKLPGDYICLTNTDTCFAPSLHRKFQQFVAKKQMIHGHRRDFGAIYEPLTDDLIVKGGNYPGLDIFLFSKDWWYMASDSFPDMLIGREGWDAILAQAMALSGSTCENNLIYHQKHSSVWEQRSNRHNLPGQLHNISLASAWLRERGYDPRNYGLRATPINWERPLPTTQETPPGGWRVSHKGASAQHYDFECVYRSMVQQFKEAGIEIPFNLKNIIIAQSYP